MGNQRKIFPFVLLAAGGLLLIGAIIVALTSGQTDQPSSLLPPTATLVEMSNIPRVTLADAKIAFDQHTAVFVDVREAPFFLSSHIPNSLSIPLADLPNLLSNLKTSDWIITVCT